NRPGCWRLHSLDGWYREGSRRWSSVRKARDTTGSKLPRRDADLGEEMRTAADCVASADAGLDYSLDSLEIADQIVAGLGRGDVRLHQFGAYLGELLCRQRGALAWAFGG